MINEMPHLDEGAARGPAPAHPRERRIRVLILLTFVTMAAEVGAGYWTGSMALLADGWHMATHVGALGLSAGAYALARQFASHRAFAFGTGKVHALAGYTSAILLGLVAVTMMAESIWRLHAPRAIDFESSLPVAVLGLLVNLVSVRLLHRDDNHEHEGHVDHDHNHRAVLLHIVADTLTSVLAIAALILGRWFGWSWLDAIMGLVGGALILTWGFSLCRNTAFELLNIDTSSHVSDGIRTVLEEMGDAHVNDLRVWPLGRGAQGCVLTVTSAYPREVDEYRDRVLSSFELAHLTVEVRRSAPD
jgi:cation diffusion facilitator family transporter